VIGNISRILIEEIKLDYIIKKDEKYEIIIPLNPSI